MESYKAVDHHWGLRSWQTLSELVDRAVKNAPPRPIEKYNDMLTDKRLSEAAKKFFERYNEVQKAQIPAELRLEQLDELLSSVTGERISRSIPLTNAKSAAHVEFLKFVCADQQWAGKHWKSARRLTIWIASTLQHPQLMMKLRRFLIPS